MAPGRAISLCHLVSYLALSPGTACASPKSGDESDQGPNRTAHTAAKSRSAGVPSSADDCCHNQVKEGRDLKTIHQPVIQLVCYPTLVRVLAGFRDRSRLRPIFVLVLCSLLCFFAVEAKAALYQPHQSQVKTLTSTKIWQSDTTPTPHVSPEIQVPLFVVAALLLIIAPPTNSQESCREQAAVAVASWFSPDLAVRPPPTI